MLNIQDIRHLHIEASSLCNARCPLCPRNLFGYPYNSGYKEVSLSYDLVKRSLSPDFLSQITSVLFNGNFGDFTANLEILSILRYFRENSNTNILISTNGSARNRDFWEELATIGNIRVEFCLDGLEDTHALYRQDTDFKRILQNARWFMDAGGVADWKMIRFKHSEDQRDACEALSKEMGFSRFIFNDFGRNKGPSFNRDGTLSHVIGGYQGFERAEDAVAWVESDPPFVIPKEKDEISCWSKKNNSIYISAEGKVYPCCWLGFSPETYDKNWLGMLNRQIKPLVSSNDLNISSLAECLEWFNLVEESWNKSSYSQGRLMQCDINCGRCKK